MSGGSLDYVYSRVHDAASTIRAEAGSEYVTDEAPNAKHLLRSFSKYLVKIADVLHDTEWFLSGDIGWEDCEKTIKKILTPTEELKHIREDAKDILKELKTTIERSENG